MTAADPEGWVSGTLRQAAADDLADRLMKIVDGLAAKGLRPKRVAYGGNGLIKRRSPKGFVLDPAAPQLLLPDGRLWHFHSRLNPDGIYYDPRVDHTRSEHGSIPLGDSRFSFLGAVVAKYNFGYRHADDDSDDSGYELGAIIGKGGGAPRFVDAGEALAEIVSSL